MIAQWNGRKPCAVCGLAIIAGEEITGGRGRWTHSRCVDGPPEAGGPAPANDHPTSSRSNGYSNGQPRARTPGAPMNDRQMALINALFAEREFTMGEASQLIDFLKTKPRRDTESNGIAGIFR